ncbi:MULTISPECIES: YlcG family protein [Klebsiella]|uniref:YlcG family protein n=1 Tax=Klebsiella TaxID=570 RepID=UPI0027DFD739|nr:MULTISPECIES: YlcG family protein [Klebsiella]
MEKRRAGKSMNMKTTECIRQRWLRLNIVRYRGSFPVAYRILRNQIRNQKAGGD